MPDDDSDSEHEEVSEAEEDVGEEDGGEEDGGEEAEPAGHTSTPPLSFPSGCSSPSRPAWPRSPTSSDWDKNADGLISRAEFTRALPPCSSASTPPRSTTSSRFDSGGPGAIDFREMRKGSTRRAPRGA